MSYNGPTEWDELPDSQEPEPEGTTAAGSPADAPVSSSEANDDTAGQTTAEETGKYWPGMPDFSRRRTPPTRRAVASGLPPAGAAAAASVTGPAEGGLRTGEERPAGPTAPAEGTPANPAGLAYDAGARDSSPAAAQGSEDGLLLPGRAADSGTITGPATGKDAIPPQPGDRPVAPVTGTPANSGATAGTQPTASTSAAGRKDQAPDRPRSAPGAGADPRAGEARVTRPPANRAGQGAISGQPVSGMAANATPAPGSAAEPTTSRPMAGQAPPLATQAGSGTAGQAPYRPAAAQAPHAPALPPAGAAGQRPAGPVGPPARPAGSAQPGNPAAGPRTPAARPGAGAGKPSAPARRRAGCGGVLGLGLFAVALAFLVFGGLLFGYVAIASGLPSPEDLQARASQFASTQIFDRQGQVLNEIADPNHGRRTAVALNQISKNLIEATIATEDPNFYNHPGVDPVGLARAVYYAVRDRDITAGPGGSTITQQLVKLVYLSSEKSVTRKVKEAVLAAEITRRYSKDTVLQIYLNEIYYGNLAYGIEAASETYFGKHASELDLAEAAMLAGLPQAPAYYDPYTKLWSAGTQPGLVKQRQSTVLRLMVEHGYITSEQADAAWQEPLKLRPLQQETTLRAPHFVYYVRDDVEKVLGPALLAKGGLRIYTTLDPKLQGIAEEEVAKQVKTLNARGATDGALVAVRPDTGEILAMVGSADFNNDKIGGQINMAISPRQPGSSIKPLTYLTAFSLPATKINDKTQISDQVNAIEPDGYWTPATAILDISTQFPDGAGRPPYVPHNYDNKEHGVVTVRSALANSYNIPAVKTLQHIGLDHLKDTAARLGITTLTRNDYGLSLTLGGGEVTLLEMTGAYATLATDGSRMPTSPIACVIDANNQVIWRGKAADQVQGCKNAPQPTMPLLVSPQSPKQVVDAQSTYLITAILSDLEARRPAFGNAANLLSLSDRPAAAKTGTTNDNRDAWTLGYTPDLAVGVWVGNADYKPMQDVAGSIGAAPIWQNVMRRALEGTPPKQFAVPQGIQRVKVCADSGTLPSEACPAQKEELFAGDRGPLPARFDLHQRLRIDKATGQLATEFTPADRVETKDFLIFPPRYQDWANKHGYPQPNLNAHQYAFAPELAITGPATNSRVTGAVQVTAHVKLPQPLVWRLEYGVGPNPVGWGVLNGPKQGDIDGEAGTFDSQRKMNEHQTNVFSLRLAAYEPGNLDYPAAVSPVVVVAVDIPTPVPSPTALPSATPTATRTPTPTPAATATPVASPTSAATNTAVPGRPTATPTTPPVAGTMHAAISQPITGTQVSGRVAVMGDAYGPNFAGYRLIYAPGASPAPSDWVAIVAGQTPSTASGGLLGFWQTQGLTPGPYTLRLEVADTGGTLSNVSVLVQVVATPTKKP